ncbi:MAG: hypothetical protein ACE5Z5_07895 [Candidatus Bathyarchaeia archaeon]
MLDGRLYHWGCLRKSKAKPTYLCLDCWSYLTGAGLAKVNWGDGSSHAKVCGNCGSSNLKRLRKYGEYVQAKACEGLAEVCEDLARVWEQRDGS